MNPLIGAQRWKIRKLQKKLDEEHEIDELKIRQTYERQSKGISIKIRSVYNKIFLVLRCSSPSFHKRHEELILEFCQHYMEYLSFEYPHQRLLDSFNQRYLSTALHNNCSRVIDLCDRLKSYCHKHHELQQKHLKDKQLREESNRIKRDNQLRWAVDKSLDSGLSKMKYWTLWFLAMHNMIREARNMLRTDSNWSKDIDKRDPDYSFTALHYASKYGHVDFIKLLLDHGADVNALIPDGRSCLHLAATYSRAAVINELLVHEAKTDAKDSFGLTPLDLAKQNNNLSAVQALQKWSSFTDPSAIQMETEIMTENENEGLQRSPGLIFLTARVAGLKASPERLSPASLRLLEKHACLCLAEGFKDEATDSLILRWRLAVELRKKSISQISLPDCLRIGEDLIEYSVRDNNLRTGIHYLDECITITNNDVFSSTQNGSHALLNLFSRRVKMCVALSYSDDAFLKDALETIDRALALITNIFDCTLGEPLEALPLLINEVDVLERMGRLSDSVQKAVALASTCRRLRGAQDSQSITLQLNYIRLLIVQAQSCVDPSERIRNLEFAGSVADETLSDLRNLNQNNSEAFSLLRRCAEYVSVIKLLKDGRQKLSNEIVQTQILRAIDTVFKDNISI